jgi:hypothetical protein
LFYRVVLSRTSPYHWLRILPYNCLPLRKSPRQLGPALRIFSLLSQFWQGPVFKRRPTWIIDNYNLRKYKSCAEFYYPTF